MRSKCACVIASVARTWCKQQSFRLCSSNGLTRPALDYGNREPVFFYQTCSLAKGDVHADEVSHPLRCSAFRSNSQCAVTVKGPGPTEQAAQSNKGTAQSVQAMAAGSRANH